MIKKVSATGTLRPLKSMSVYAVFVDQIESGI
jgi:hypothetical protein